jgi:hypothetical protein
MSRLRYASLLTLALAAALAAGCGSFNQQVADDMRQVLGQPLDKLVAHWGPPTERRVAAGKRLVTWELGADGVTTTADANAAGGFCNATVELNDKDRVVGYYWDGNRCAAAADRL